MANRFPLIVNPSTNQIQELANLDSLDLTGNTITYGSYTITLPSLTGTLATVAGTETLTNKTINLANNTLTATSAQIAAAVSDETGSGSLVFATSPTLVTPVLGVASATSINKVAITAPATGSTLTIADGKTLTASNTLTFTGTDASSVAFGAGGTVVYTSNKLSALSSTSSSELAGVISDETGSGSLVFATSPTLVTPNLGTPSAVTLTNATGLPVSTGISGLGTGVATFLATPSSANLAAALTDETGSGNVVFSASPTFTGTANFAAISTTGNTSVGGNLTVTGDFTVNGTTTTINATTISVDDKNIELGSVATPTDTTADGGGITLKGATNKTFNWVNATGAWTSSEHIDIGLNKAYYINSASVLNATTLGSSVVNSSLTSVGTLTNLTVTNTITGSVSGNAGTATKLATARTISLSGDVTGSVSFDGSGNADIATTIAANSVALGTDTTGNYVASITNGSYLTGANGGSEGAALTLAVDATTTNTASKVVARDASGNFAAGTITAALSGNASTATKLETARTINGTSFDGSANITITANTTNALTIGTGLSGTSFNGGSAVTIAIDSTVATLTGSQTLTNKTLTAPTVTNGTFTDIFLNGAREKVTVSATAATGTVNFDYETQSILYYTSNASGNWTLNVRGDSGTTLNSLMAVGDSITITFLATNGATPYYQNAITIDGTSVTPKYQNGVAYTSGNANSIDIYTLTIIKTAATPTYTAFAGQTKFA